MSLAEQGKRKVPSYNEVGEGKQERKEEMKQYIEPEELEEATEDINSVDAIVESIVHAPKPKEKEQVSIYLDSDVKKGFERFGKKHGKGARSNLINNFLLKALKEYIK